MRHFGAFSVIIVFLRRFGIFRIFGFGCRSFMRTATELFPSLSIMLSLRYLKSELGFFEGHSVVVAISVGAGGGRFFAFALAL